jgi:hypothetical protein
MSCATKLITAACLFCFAAHVSVLAQSADDPPSPAGQNAGHTPPPPARREDVPPGLKKRGISFHINARVLEKNETEETEAEDAWNETWSMDSIKNAIPGQPVSLKLVGNNVVVVVQFMPYIRRTEPGVLVAQGQVWMEDEHNNISYETTIQSIPLRFNEKIYYFPLGEQDSGAHAFIEICLEMSPYPQ